MKRLGSILLALALVISSLEGINISFADESDKEISLEQKNRKDSLPNLKTISSDESINDSDELVYENFKYRVSELDKSEVIITGYIGNEENVVIPSEINGMKVIEIGDNAFYECSDLTSVDIPEGVTSIGWCAFEGCSNLTSVYIPQTVIYIGRGAFAECSNLKNIDIPKEVEAIDYAAFEGCSNLTSIDIPEKVTYIGELVFHECGKLTEINVSESNPEYKSIDGSLFSKDGKTLIVVPGGKSSCIIPKGVTKIVIYAFSGCSNLKDINIPEGVIYIEGSAFEGCSNLTSINIPKGVTYIGWNAFEGCSNLKKIYIPQSVTEIGEEAFSGCNNLTIYGVANSKAEEYAKEYGIPFKTLARDISSVSITLSSDSYSYTGSQIKPSITVKDREKILKNKTDYTVSYGTNVNAGTGTVTITGINDYEGSKTTNFTINKRSISSSKVTVSTIKNQTYTGKSIKPSITLKQGSKTLKNGTDYTLSYSNNTNIGKATITIKGKGNYSSSRKVTFKIIPKTVTNVKQTYRSTSTIKLSWSKDSKVTGYQVYRSTSKNGTYKKVATLSSYSKNYYTNSKLSSGKTYYYKVRAYKKVGSTYYYGNYSSICTASTKCSKPSITVTSPKTKTAKISWKKISGSNGYKVYRATSKNGKYTLVKTVKSGDTTSYTNTSLTKGKTYYYKVKAYKVVNGSNIYSDYSSVKSVKVK